MFDCLGFGVGLGGCVVVVVVVVWFGIWVCCEVV